MKRMSLYIIIIALSIIFENNLYAQNFVIALDCSNRINEKSTKPEKIYPLFKVKHLCRWYNEQSELWKKEITKNPKNADAWYNYYKSKKYSDSIVDGVTMEKELKDIIEKMEKKIPNTYEYNLLKYDQAGMDLNLFYYLKKAYDMDPDRLDAYPNLVAYYEAIRDTSSLKEIIVKWYKTNDFSPGIMAFNFNELKPLDKNAILIVNGDKLYYPKKALQYALGIRKDVKILLACFLDIPSYRDSIFKELNIEIFDKKYTDFKDGDKYSQAIIKHLTTNIKDRSIYFSTSSGYHYYEKLRENLYNEGLVYKFSTEKYDNVAIIKRNYEKIFMKDYLSNNFTNDVSQSIVNNANLNYTPSLLILYEHYKVSGDNDKANEIKAILYDLYKNQEYYDENVFIQLNDYFDKFDKKE